MKQTKIQWCHVCDKKEANTTRMFTIKCLGGHKLCDFEIPLCEDCIKLPDSVLDNYFNMVEVV